MKPKFALILLICLTLPRLSLASGLLVSPSKLDFDISKLKQKEKTITVANTTEDVQIIDIYFDEHEEWFEIKPKIFSLTPGEWKKISISPVLGKPWFYSKQTKLYLLIIAKPLKESSIKVSSGIKLPVTVTSNSAINPGKLLFPTLLVMLILLIIAASLIAQRKHRHLKK